MYNFSLCFFCIITDIFITTSGILALDTPLVGIFGVRDFKDGAIVATISNFSSSSGKAVSCINKALLGVNFPDCLCVFVSSETAVLDLHKGPVPQTPDIRLVSSIVYFR